MTASLHSWLPAPLDLEVARSVERLRRAKGALAVALMPDVHLSHDVCVGVAFGTDAHLYPQAVGGDIGCGVAALRFDGVKTFYPSPERRYHIHFSYSF